MPVIIVNLFFHTSIVVIVNLFPDIIVVFILNIFQSILWLVFSPLLSPLSVRLRSNLLFQFFPSYIIIILPLSFIPVTFLRFVFTIIFLPFITVMSLSLVVRRILLSLLPFLIFFLRLHLPKSFFYAFPRFKHIFSLKKKKREKTIRH